MPHISQTQQGCAMARNIRALSDVSLQALISELRLSTKLAQSMLAVAVREQRKRGNQATQPARRGTADE